MRIVSLIFLLLIPLPFLTSVYRPGNLPGYIIAGAVQGALIAAAAWTLAKKRSDRAPAGFLIANWIVTSLALNMDAPPRGAAWLATIPDQEFRYYALVAGGLIALAGLALLAARLRDAGERTCPVLAVTAAAVSQVLFTLSFLALPHATTARFTYAARSGADPEWWAIVAAILASFGIVQRNLIYLAMILYAVSLRRAAFLGARSTACLASLTALLAVANMLVHIPPAVPLVLPYLAGVLLTVEQATGLPGRHS